MRWCWCAADDAPPRLSSAPTPRDSPAGPHQHSTHRARARFHERRYLSTGRPLIKMGGWVGCLASAATREGLQAGAPLTSRPLDDEGARERERERESAVLWARRPSLGAEPLNPDPRRRARRLWRAGGLQPSCSWSEARRQIGNKGPTRRVKKKHRTRSDGPTSQIDDHALTPPLSPCVVERLNRTGGAELRPGGTIPNPPRKKRREHALRDETLARNESCSRLARSPALPQYHRISAPIPSRPRRRSNDTTEGGSGPPTGGAPAKPARFRSSGDTRAFQKSGAGADRQLRPAAAARCPPSSPSYMVPLPPGRATPLASCCPQARTFY